MYKTDVTIKVFNWLGEGMGIYGTANGIHCDIDLFFMRYYHSIGNRQ